MAWAFFLPRRACVGSMGVFLFYCCICFGAFQSCFGVVETFSNVQVSRVFCDIEYRCLGKLQTVKGMLITRLVDECIT